MVQLLIALGLNAIFWSGMGVVVARRSGLVGVDLVLATIVAGCAAIVIALELLSVGGLINATSIAVICLAAGLAGLWLSRHPSSTAPSDGHRTDAVDALQPKTRRGRSLFGLFAIGMAAWAALVYLLLGFTLPVETVSDAPIYHLPFAIAWWKAGSITLVPTPFGEAAATYYPANGDLWLTWLIGSGSVALAKVGQWPFMIIGAVALYGLARLAHAEPTAAVLPPALWIALPIVVTQSSLANIDLIWTAFYFIAVYFLARGWWGSTRDAPLWLFLFALSCGVVVGTKVVGAVFVALLLPWAVGCVLRRPQPLRQLAYIAMGLLLPSGYWYVRNIVLTGNPLYPLALSAFDYLLTDGWYRPAAMEATAYHLPATAWRTLLARLDLIAGRMGVALVAAGLLAGWIQALRPSVHVTARRALGLYCGLALAQGFIYWYVIPYNTQERFLLPALGLALVPLATVAAGHPLLHFALALSLASQLLGRTAGWQDEWYTLVRVYDNPLALGDMRITLLLPASIAGALLVLRWAPRARVPIAALTVLAGCWFSAAPAAARLSEQPIFQFYPRTGFAVSLLPGWEIVEHAAPAGARVAYAGTNLPYYLLGSALRNEVHYVNINDHPDWLPHDYHRERVRTGQPGLADTPFPQWDRVETDFNAWIANLRRREIDVLFVARENRHGQLATDTTPLPRFPIERQWADAHPELFMDLGPFQDAPGGVPWVRVYRLKPSP